MISKSCEILAPVGRLSDIETIINAGADAVYVGIKGLSARPIEADLNLDEVREAVKIAASYNVKIYATINGNISEDKLNETKNSIRYLDEIGVNAMIISDIGMINFVSQLNLSAALHISTLTGVYNTEALRALKKYGMKRLIISSDLFIDEIASITEKNPDIEYEIVADGGICYNSNRQCLLPHINTMEDFNVYCQTDYFLKEDDNVISDAKRIGNCQIHLHKMMGIYLGIGIQSFKIEGRTNPLWYIEKRVRDMKKSKDYYMERLSDIPSYMHYIVRNAEWSV